MTFNRFNEGNVSSNKISSNDDSSNEKSKSSFVNKNVNVEKLKGKILSMYQK